MAATSLQLTFARAFVVLFLVSIAVTTILAAQDHDVPVSVDGIRCDSCGSECSVMCGSRNFRACCYNYIKKRSLPWSNLNPSESQDAEGNDTQQPRSKPLLPPSSAVDLKSAISSSNPTKTALIFKGIAGNGKHYLRGRVTELGDSLEEAEFYPISVQDIVTNVVRALDSRKFSRQLPFK